MPRSNYCGACRPVDLDDAARADEAADDPRVLVGFGTRSQDPLTAALALAIWAHYDQRDAVGESYILHPLRVMMRVREEEGSLEAQMVAILHDVVEDTHISLGEVRRRFGQKIASLIDALTRRYDGREPYDQYIGRVIAAGEEAQRIKELDLVDNLRRIEPVRQIDPVKAARLERKYNTALIRLWEARGIWV